MEQNEGVKFIMISLNVGNCTENRMGPIKCWEHWEQFIWAIIVLLFEGSWLVFALRLMH
jgi:hypothetical protein